MATSGWFCRARSQLARSSSRWRRAHSTTSAFARGSRSPASTPPSTDTDRASPRLVDVEMRYGMIALVPVHVDHDPIEGAHTGHQSPVFITGTGLARRGSSSKDGCRPSRRLALGPRQTFEGTPNEILRPGEVPVQLESCWHIGTGRRRISQLPPLNCQSVPPACPCAALGRNRSDQTATRRRQDHGVDLLAQYGAGLSTGLVDGVDVGLADHDHIYVSGWYVSGSGPAHPHSVGPTSRTYRPPRRRPGLPAPRRAPGEDRTPLAGDRQARGSKATPRWA